MSLFSGFQIKERVLFLILVIAIWPSLFHIYELVQLKSPRKTANLNRSFLSSPVLLVFDRKGYFPKISFFITYKNGEAETVNLDSQLYSQINPYPAGVITARVFSMLGRRKMIAKVLDNLFCKKLIKSFTPRLEVASVVFKPEYLSDTSLKPKVLRHTCKL